VQFAVDTVPPGASVLASGRLTSGDYLLCVVPDSTYTANEPYDVADALNCVPAMTVEDGTIPPVEVWAAALPGRYDLLALAGDGSNTIVTGDGLGPEAGLVVQALVSGPRVLSAVLVLLALGILVLPRRQRHKS
jgi:hypothetical protein